MKLHLPKVLLAAVIAASACFSQVKAEDTNGIDDTKYADYAYTIVQWTGGTTENKTNGICYGPWYVANYDAESQQLKVATSIDTSYDTWQEVICSTTSDHYCTLMLDAASSDTNGGVYYDIDAVKLSGLIVTADSGITGLNANSDGGRNFNYGKAGGAAGYTAIGGNFTLDVWKNTLTLAGTQTWDVASGATFTLTTKNSSIALSSGAEVTQVGGTVDFSSKTLTGSGAYTVSSGSLTKASFAEGTTLVLKDGVSLDAITMQRGSILDLSAVTFSSETALLSSSKVTLAAGVDLVLSADVEIGDAFKLYDTNVTIDSIIIDGNNYSAARSITQENGTITFTGFGAMFADMVWAGGDGTWNTSNKNWNSATGGNGIAFANGDSVTFDSTAAVVAAEGVSVGGMTVSGAETKLTLTSSNGGYVQGNVTVTEGATLILATETKATGLIRGSIDVVNGTLQLDAKDVTGYNGGANSTQSIKIAAGSELLLNNIENETFAGSLVLNGTMKSIGATTSRWDLYGGASLTVEDGNTGAIENATLRLRKDNATITVGNNATLTTATIDKGTEGNGILLKNGAGSLIVNGSVGINGITISGGSVSLNAGGSTGAISLTGGSTTHMAFNAASGATAEAPTTYTVGNIGMNNAANWQRTVTIAENTLVKASSFDNAWGMKSMTVDGRLEISGLLKMASGGNTLGENNIINGSGSISTGTLEFSNVGVYTLNVAELTVATSSNISRNTQILGGDVSFANLTLKGATLQVDAGEVSIANLTMNYNGETKPEIRVNGGEVSMTGTTGRGTITGNAGIINMVGGTHTLDTLDLSNGGDSTAQVNLSSSAALSVGTLWGASSSAINVGEGSSVTASGVKVIGTANATTIAASQNSLYGADNADFTITNATVEVAPAAESSTTLGNKIVDSNVTNTGAGELIVSDMTVTDASKVQSALTGDMTVTKLTLASGLSETVAAVTTSGALTLGSISLDLTEYSAGNYTLVSATGDGSIIWDATAENALSYTGTLGEGLEAIVDFGSDNKTLQLTISEMVTPENPSITTTLPTSVTDVLGYEKGMLTLQVEGLLTENTMAVVDILGDPSTDALMAEVLRLVGETKMVAITLVGTAGGELVADAFDKVVFVNEKGEGYYGEMVGGQLMYNVDCIPEPASATLSLAALMMLCARRRRQK